jgi:hypothetical protein
MVSVWNYAIVHAALQARSRLLQRNLSELENRQCLTLLRLGQQIVMRLQQDGVRIPEIDLRYPLASEAYRIAAGPTPDVRASTTTAS